VGEPSDIIHVYLYMNQSSWQVRLVRQHLEDGSAVPQLLQKAVDALAESAKHAFDGHEVNPLPALDCELRGLCAAVRMLYKGEF
jgi:hypothetical protein